MSIVERLTEAIGRLEPVEAAVPAGPWQSRESYCCVSGYWIDGWGEVGDGECAYLTNPTAVFIAAMRPTSDPAYYTNLLRDAALEIQRLRDNVLAFPEDAA